MGRVYDTAAFRALPREHCIIHELLGTECEGAIARHHVHPLAAGGDPQGRTVPVCAVHHPQLEALARRVYGTPEWKRCPHFHPTQAGREACERRLNVSAA
jgi:hypothetical protein